MADEMNNTMIEEIEVTEVNDIQEDNYELPAEYDEGGNGGMTVVKVVGALAVGGLIALGIKKKDDIQDWFNQRRIKKLEKQGFKVIWDETDEFDNYEVDCDDDGTGNIIEIPEEK